jgi:hypothetical protein
MKRPLSTLGRARRRFLISSFAGLLVGIGPCRLCLGSEEEDPTPDPPWWLTLTGDRDAVLRLGNAYLRSRPEERALAVLVAEIEKAIPADGDLETALNPQAAYAAALQRRVRDDYRHGALVSVNAWLLSRTEARLYAAAAMLYQIGGEPSETGN